ncbi:hypothetical protein CQA37_09825, partial [Helicobacter sp. MIT 99-10781]|uniref:hypothetical protein n=2 Tax=unclassified Helicobacter TaxID=2593540 RepID=UPI000E2089F6
YWNAWDSAAKAKVVERLRSHEKGYNLLTLNKQPIYPDITQDMQADLIESGELKIISFRKLQIITSMWADENREEAKNPKYQELLALNKKDMSEAKEANEYRVIQ